MKRSTPKHSHRPSIVTLSVQVGDFVSHLFELLGLLGLLGLLLWFSVCKWLILQDLVILNNPDNRYFIKLPADIAFTYKSYVYMILYIYMHIGTSFERG